MKKVFGVENEKKPLGLALLIVIADRNSSGC